MKSEFSVGLADKVCSVWDGEGGTPAELNSFAENDALVRGLLTILRGGAVVKPLALEGIPRPQPSILWPIDHAKPFNPATFIGVGWNVWRGPVDGNGLKGDEERDPRAVTLVELDVNKVQLVTHLKRGESVTTGEERIKRLKVDGRIRLDGNAFQAFWNNKELIPARFKDRVNGNVQFIFFDGVILRSPGGRRYALCLYFDDDGSWVWNYNWLDSGRVASDPSAVLASQNLVLCPRETLCLTGDYFLFQYVVIIYYRRQVNMRATMSFPLPKLVSMHSEYFRPCVWNSVVHVETSKNEDTWYRMPGHYDAEYDTAQRALDG